MRSQRYDRPRGTPDCPLGCIRFETRRIMPQFTLLHWHPELEIFYAVKGSFEIYAPQGCHTLTAGELYLVSPGEDHGIRALEPEGEYWSVAFSLGMVTGNASYFLQTELVSPLQSGKLHLPRKLAPEHPAYSTVLSQVVTVTGTDPRTNRYKPTAHVAANVICAALLPHCTTVTSAAEGCTREHDAAKTCVQYIHDHYSEPITVEQLAELVHLHPNYLCGLFRKHIGKPIVSYLNLHRIRQARNLLSSTDLSLQQVAERTGFNSVSYFSRTFKAEMGMSPGAFSRTYQKSTNTW